MITGLDLQTAQATQRAMRCAECGGGLLAPHLGNGEFGVKCLKDDSHEGMARPRRTKKLADGRTYDVYTQKPIDETQALAIPDGLDGMLDLTRKAVQAGKFPEQMTPVQVEAVARLSIAMGLNPFLGHIMIYQGRPFIGIDGRRTKDTQAGHHPSIKFRMMDRAEREELTALGVVNADDVIRICVLTTEWGNTVEAVGRVLGRERDPNQKGAYYLPTVNRALEMAEKRAEARARRMAYGDMVPARPEYLDGVIAIEEGDVVEGEARDVDLHTSEIQDRPPLESPTGELFPPDEAPDNEDLFSRKPALPNELTIINLFWQVIKPYGWDLDRVNRELGMEGPVPNYLQAHSPRPKAVQALYDWWRQKEGV